MDVAEIVSKYGLVEAELDKSKAPFDKRIWRGGRCTAGDPYLEWCGPDQFLDGRILNDDLSGFDPNAWYYIEGWNDSRYRVVWVCFGNRMIFTYCEGDLCLVHCGSFETFCRELDDAAMCYGESYNPVFLAAGLVA